MIPTPFYVLCYAGQRKQKPLPCGAACLIHFRARAMLTIRAETEEGVDDVRGVNGLALGRPDEARLVIGLRGVGPHASLVAIEDERVC